MIFKSFKANKFYALVTFLILLKPFCSTAQTTILSPTGDGGFETGSTFSSNGWTTLGGTATQNVWFLGNGATSGFSGSRCAYISNNVSGTHAYTTTTTATSFLYRNITIPTGHSAINLSFKWLSQGESYWDALRVWIVPTSYTPTVGTKITSTGVAPTGRIQLGTELSLHPGWTSASLSIPNEYVGNTFRLIFEWSNDNLSGNQPPAAIDDISITAVPITSYCSYSSTGTSYYINSFSTTGGNTNITNNTTGYSTAGYGDFTSQEVSQYTSSTVNFTASLNGAVTGLNIWVDWNDNFDFSDPGENVYSSSAYVTTATGSFTVPSGASVGTHRIRVTTSDTTNPLQCGNIFYGETEDYTFRVLPPLPCSGNPSNMTVFLNSQTSSTINWTAGIPAPANGYQYYLSTSNIQPNASTVPTGSVPAGVTSLNLTGLIPGTTYYIWIRSNCDNTLGQGNWVGELTFVQPTCTIGTGTGTTSLGCPNTLAGGLGLNGSPAPPIDCSSPCVTLEAIHTPIKETTGYTVESITYLPPYQFSCMRNPVSVNIDDKWSKVINLPFDFCFYGNTYNKCLIGSNGILTFDITKNIPQGSCSWSYSSNIPTAGHYSLVENSIFGVFHDINPSKGGEVGWELITLNTGCRALVASWSNVPMYYNDPANDYTGMMVLYENTNIIEIYVQKKRLTTHMNTSNTNIWNDGNAIIGIQNANGTLATVAPGRNGLDPDWTATNEAWRFTPNGNVIPATFKWFEGSGTSGPLVGTTQNINVCPTITTTYTAEVTYNLCNGLTYKNTAQTTVTVSNVKTWSGSSNTDWNTASNWIPSGVPTNTNSVVIPNTVKKPVISGAMQACNLTIQNGGELTILPNASLVVTNYVNIDSGGVFTVKNNGSLVQINNVVNTVNGLFAYERSATNIKGSDYIYWSSPVINQDLSTIYNSPVQGPKFVWNTTAINANGGLGTWSSASGAMTSGKGYIIRGSNSYGMPASTINSVFNGAPNNGNVVIKALRGGMLPSNVGPSLTYSNPVLNAWDDNWNLVGNPYPSAINALQFLSANSSELLGTVRLWRHLNTPAVIPSPFYQNFIYNYNSNDYLTINFTGSTTPGASEIIKTGQAFMVQRKEGSQDLTGVDITFNNAMRRDGTTILSNGSFFRTENPESSIEKHRVWLDIVDDTNLTSETTLIGYVEGATLDWDDKFDSTVGLTSQIGIYSFVDSQKTIIQGRSLPFDINDIVPLGINVHSNGNYHIAINSIDGLFVDKNQTIYLEDKDLNTIHNLTSNPYSFFSNKGTFENRFVLRFTNNLLNHNNFEFDDLVTIYAAEYINIKSTSRKIKDVAVYSVDGKKIIDDKNVDLNEYIISKLIPTTNILMVKVTLDNGRTITKKIIY